MIAEVAQMLTGWFLADLLSGVVHCIFDRTTWAANWPILGELHRDANDHHADPNAVGRLDAWQTSWKPALAAVLLLAVAELAMPPLLETWLPWLIVPLAIGGALSTRTHVWAHRAENNALVKGLQSYGLILRPQGHARHHAGSHTRGYGALNGWSDPLIDWMLDRWEKPWPKR